MIKLGIKNMMGLYETLSAVFLAAVFIPWIFAASVPDGIAVPVHFDMWGRVDSWGDKTDFASLPIVAVIVWFAFSVVQYVELRRSNMTYSVMLRILKMLIMLIFAYINIGSYAIARGWMATLNAVFIWALLVALVGVALYYCIMVKIIKKRI